MKKYGWLLVCLPFLTAAQTDQEEVVIPSKTNLFVTLQTGVSTDTARPGLAAVMERLEAGGAQALCVNSLDRLTRRADQLAAMTQWCRENGFTIQEVPDISEGE